ncbi:MAG: ISAzo13 family transposase [Oscillospiraceae bacterium]|nr:ISAzo13 family transposase [Oscillospiraceae bacterium]
MEERILTMLPHLNEAQKRLFLASEAIAYGRGGISETERISGVSRTTIRKGIKEIKSGKKPNERIRNNGGGRKAIEIKHPNIEDEIRRLVDGSTYGDPERVLSYTTESLRKIEEELNKRNIKIGRTAIAKVLDSMDYSRQQNQKMQQVGTPHPDRNAQFEHINKTAAKYLEAGDPVISVDTKKKENIGNFANKGTEYRNKKDPRKVLDHDFPIKELGKISPYGVYNLNSNTGFVNVGTSHDTSEFAVESISRWWETVGKHTFLNKGKIYITCDSGGSNGYRVRMWKYQLQQFANRTSLEVEVSHFPRGTSKWNKVEHRLFCYISKNWQGKPLVDVQTAVDLIGSTKTATGLEVICVRDDTEYALAKKVSDEDFELINIVKIEPFVAWNYKILPAYIG